MLGSNYYGSISGYFAHRAYNRINSLLILNKIPGDGRNFFLHQLAKCITGLYAELQRRKQSLFMPHHVNFLMTRWSNFQYQITLKWFFSVVGYFGACLAVFSIIGRAHV